MDSLTRHKALGAGNAAGFKQVFHFGAQARIFDRCRGTQAAQAVQSVAHTLHTAGGLALDVLEKRRAHELGAVVQGNFGHELGVLQAAVGDAFNNPTRKGQRVIRAVHMLGTTAIDHQQTKYMLAVAVNGQGAVVLSVGKWHQLQRRLRGNQPILQSKGAARVGGDITGRLPQMLRRYQLVNQRQVFAQYSGFATVTVHATALAPHIDAANIGVKPKINIAAQHAGAQTVGIWLFFRGQHMKVRRYRQNLQYRGVAIRPQAAAKTKTIALGAGQFERDIGRVAQKRAQLGRDLQARLDKALADFSHQQNTVAVKAPFAVGVITKPIFAGMGVVVLQGFFQ